MPDDEMPQFDESAIPEEDRGEATEENADYEAEEGGENVSD